ncbi:MAG: hypothetical protein KJ614_17835 [Gammaproteobacteria bacterium]|uniref:hypothetical protein n=1 Tax=Rhodoferax sp. TaxID=50421 RepID=UPI0017E716E1|nr:hypothetical protein [Rhodoferax sp.]MBU3900749.1 hypothetical protein [Gammaproteobacteria bacterium]MBA3056706.1 hypothetical protein [Rhodoferax sp.]MBU4079500.1 hypothetical protein [Gammaproteobacteria bacterium]MBU4114792.1 hypothetical protein [Gammaproteobacteria bacterium]MBU4170537.1 hypothetical protein [Gammaproteobacteria bacterium]
MRYKIENEVVTFYLDNPKRTEDTTANQSFAGTGLTEKQVVVLADCLVKKFRGATLGTQQNATTHFLRPLFAYFKANKISWPTTSSDWQITIYSFFQFFLTNSNWSQALTAFRMREWQTRFGGLLEFLKEEEVIPHDIVIPKIDQKRIKSIAKDQPLLGQPRKKLVDLTTQPKKLLVDISVGMTDANYLNAVEKKCRHLIDVIRDTCQEHWEGLMKDGATGRTLAEIVTDAKIEEETAAKRFGTYSGKSHRLCLFASAAQPQGHNWALAVTRHKIATGSKIDCVSIRTLRASPFFRNDVFGHEIDRFSALSDLTALTREQRQAVQIPSQFYRFAGLLSNIDAAAACCLLTIEHPEFTSESLQDAKLLNVHGKPYLLLTDSHYHSILSVDKPRAGKRKSVVLSSRSQQLVKDILQWTAPVRDVLRRAGDKTWRYLFLGVKQRGGINGALGVIEGRPIYLHGGQDTIGLATLHPALSRNGLDKGSFDYRRLRNTLGVIRWFETGSILEMSRRLGNTRKVALEHYLPPALLHAWNTRIIRRFQNTLIVLAAYDEPYLLEVTDFSTMADLQHFIAQLIVDYPTKTSPLAEELQRRIGTAQHLEAGSSALVPGLLNVRLSPKSLAFLYSYSDLSKRMLTESDIDKIDVISGLAPRQFIDLATLLKHAAESNKIHASLSESLDVPLLKQVHGGALAMQAGLDAQFSRLAIKHHWAENL